MDRSLGNTQDKCNEDIFFAVLLMCGPDPEPQNCVSSDEYTAWLENCEDAIQGLGVADEDAEDLFMAYWMWLQKRGMAWAGK